MRRVLLKVLPTWPVMQWILHWDDHSATDLDEIDDKVAAGTANDDDFLAALACQLRMVNCLGCGAGLMAVVADTSPPILVENLEQRLRGHEFIQVCPSCAAPLHPQVVKLLG